MIKIKAPFIYTGNKSRHYDIIKKSYIDSGKNNFVDLFAGGLTVPINIKADCGGYVHANVKDEFIEGLLKIGKEKTLELYGYIMNIILEGEADKVNFRTDKAAFNRCRDRYNRIFYTNCECCGSRLKISEASDDLHLVATTLCDMCFGSTLRQHSLGYNAFNVSKTEVSSAWFDGVSFIDKVTFDLMNWDSRFEDAFIHLDPPYITSIKESKKGIIGTGYATQTSTADTMWTWAEDDNLIDFIHANLGRGNVFMLWGSIGNHLYDAIQERLPQAEIVEIERFKNIFGRKKVEKVLEYYAIIKD